MKTLPSKTLPSEWYFEQMWKNVYVVDVEAISHLKKALRLHTPTGNSQNEQKEINERAAIHQIVDSLDHVTLAVAFEAIRLLSLFPIELAQ